MNSYLIVDNHHKPMFHFRNEMDAIQQIRKFFPNAELLHDREDWIISIEKKMTVGMLRKIYLEQPGCYTVEMFGQYFVLFNNLAERESWIITHLNEFKFIIFENKMIILNTEKDIVGQLRYLPIL